MSHLLCYIFGLVLFAYVVVAFIVAVTALQRRVNEMLDADDDEIAASAVAEGALWPFVAWAMVTRRGGDDV